MPNPGAVLRAAAPVATCPDGTKRQHHTRGTLPRQGQRRRDAACGKNRGAADQGWSDASPSQGRPSSRGPLRPAASTKPTVGRKETQRKTQQKLRRSEEHTSELQSPDHLVCRLLLEKKKNSTKKSTEER